MFTTDLIRAEMARAEEKFGPFTSAAEGLGVLVEEVAELREAIRSKKRESVREEAVQVAAVAARIAACCDNAAFNRRSEM